MASFILSRISSALMSSSKVIIAVIASGIFLVSTTWIFLSLRSIVCLAAMMMFLLLGKMNISSALILSMASIKSSVDGFIVWPPVTTSSTFRSLNIFVKPSPELTAMKPYFLCSFGLLSSFLLFLYSSSLNSISLC